MSLASWKKEFYRTPASKVSKRYALKHSIKKWTGLKPSNRTKHNVSIYDGKLMNNADISNSEDNIDVDCLEIDDNTCALCQHYREGWCCDTCPLVEAGIDRCFNDESPFDKFLSHGRISPMIMALNRALKKVKSK